MWMDREWRVGGVQETGLLVGWGNGILMVLVVHFWAKSRRARAFMSVGNFFLLCLFLMGGVRKAV